MGLINPQDRLHKAAHNFCKNQEESDELYLLQSVLIEFKTKYLKYYNAALADVIKIISEQVSAQEKIKKLDGLKEQNPKLQNFYKIILAQLGNDFSADKFLVLRSDVIKIINNTVEVIEKNLGFKFREMKESSEPTVKQKKFLKEAEKLVFSDSDDKSIFTEFVFVSFEEELKKFYSNDKTFINQAKKEIQKVKAPKLNFFLLEEKKEEPFYEIIS
jgi:septum formation topological specificity factor MinE